MRAALFTALALISGGVLVQSPSQAQIIFSDNFDTNNSGLNVVPSGWTIGNSGTLDLIGVCNGNAPFFDHLPGNGCYVDLDGSTNSPGLLQKSFSLNAGVSYALNFDLGSSQSNVVDVVFGTATAQYSLTGAQAFSTKTLTFTPNTAGTYNLTFLTQGGDNNGVYLDNVQLAAPAPLPLLGPIAALAARRRLQSYSRQLKQRF